MQIRLTLILNTLLAYFLDKCVNYAQCILAHNYFTYNNIRTFSQFVYVTLKANILTCSFILLILLHAV